MYLSLSRQQVRENYVGFFVIISHSNLCIFPRYRMDRDHPVSVFSFSLHIHMTIPFASYST
jgi:hypothetical protein